MNKLLFNSLIVAALGWCAGNAFGQVTSDRLVNSSKEPQNWLMYSGDYSGHRFSTLNQIDAKNAAFAGGEVGLSKRRAERWLQRQI